MKQPTIKAEKELRVRAKDKRKSPSREFVHSLYGKYKGQGLMAELMVEKKREKELRFVSLARRRLS